MTPYEEPSAYHSHQGQYFNTHQAQTIHPYQTMMPAGGAAYYSGDDPFMSNAPMASSAGDSYKPFLQPKMIRR